MSQVYLDSILGVGRLGAMKLGYFTPRCPILINGVRVETYVKYGSARISDQRAGRPSTASLRILANISGAPTVTEGQPITIGLGTTANPMFTGYVTNVALVFEGGLLSQRAFDISCIDEQWFLDRRNVYGRWQSTDAGEIAYQILSGFTSGFDITSKVNRVTGVTIDDFSCKGDQVSNALSSLATAAAVEFRVQDGVVYFTATPNWANPDTVTENNTLTKSLKHEVDLAQVRTRVRVVGAANTTADAAAVGDTILSMTDTTIFSSTGGSILTPDGQIITYTGKGSLAAPGTPAGATRTGGLRSITITRSGSTGTATSSTNHGYSTGDVVTHAGAAQPEYNGTFTITVTGNTTYTFTVTGTPTSPATGTITAYVEIGGSVGVGSYRYKSTFYSARGETLGSTASSTVTVSAVATPTGGSVAERSPKVCGNLVYSSLALGYSYAFAFLTSAGETIVGGGGSATISQVAGPSGAATLTPTTGGSMTSAVGYYYLVTFVTASGESLAGNGGFVSMGASDTQVGLTNIATSADARVTGRKIYRTGANGAGGYRLVTTINDNSTTSYNDTTADGSLGAAMPVTDTASTGQVSLSSIPTSSDQRVIGRVIYRTSLGGSTYKRLAVISDNATTTYTDNISDESLGNDALATSTAGGAQVRVTSLATSADPRVVGRRVYRTLTGGTDYKLVGTVSDNVTAYFIDNASDASLASAQALPTVGTIVGLTGIPSSSTGSITAAIPAGTSINLTVLRNDTSAQAALAALEGGDGIHEHQISDSTLVTDAAAAAVGDADLENFSSANVKAGLVTRDQNAFAGRTLTFNFSAPVSVTGAYLAQSVEITDIEILAVRGALYPKRTVQCADTRFTLQDVLRAVQIAQR